MSKHWNRVEDYDVLEGGERGRPAPYLIFGCEIGDRYRIRIEKTETGDMMYFNLTPQQAMDFGNRMVAFAKRMGK